MPTLGDHMRGFGYLFYVISPNETSYPTVEDIPKPDYVTKVRYQIIASVKLNFYYAGVLTSTRMLSILKRSLKF